MDSQFAMLALGLKLIRFRDTSKKFLIRMQAISRMGFESKMFPGESGKLLGGSGVSTVLQGLKEKEK